MDHPLVQHQAVSRAQHRSNGRRRHQGKRSRKKSPKPNPSTNSLSLTLHDEMDTRCLGVIVCLHGAGVGALIVHIHILDLDAVLGFGVGQEHHPRVQAPLVIAGIEDAAAVQPGHPGHPVVHGAPGERQRGDPSVSCSWVLSLPPLPALLVLLALFLALLSAALSETKCFQCPERTRSALSLRCSGHRYPSKPAAPESCPRASQSLQMQGGQSHPVPALHSSIPIYSFANSQTNRAEPKPPSQVHTFLGGVRVVTSCPNPSPVILSADLHIPQRNTKWCWERLR